MEKLILKCGRYMPSAAGDTESRVKLLEAYLSGLTQELEFLVEELDRVLQAQGMFATVGDGVAEASAQGGEGSV